MYTLYLNIGLKNFISQDVKLYTAQESLPLTTRHWNGCPLYTPLASTCTCTL